MNISNRVAPGFVRGAFLQSIRQINESQNPYVAKNQVLTNCSMWLFRYSKSSQLERKDLPSHLNLYNPMNISLGGNSFTTTVHGTKVRQQFILANDNF